MSSISICRRTPPEAVAILAGVATPDSEKSPEGVRVSGAVKQGCGLRPDQTVGYVCDCSDYTGWRGGVKDGPDHPLRLLLLEITWLAPIITRKIAGDMNENPLKGCGMSGNVGVSGRRDIEARRVLVRGDLPPWP